MAPVVRALRQAAGNEAVRVVVTAQHREMLDQVLEQFGIEPDVDLDLMRNDQSPMEFAGRALPALDAYLAREQPDWVVVQGDTTTTMVAALAAFHRKICVAHVEAGLRTGDKYRPFPEEINRRIVTLVSDEHFAPTAWARTNLLREGVPDERIHVTGNPVVDAVHYILQQPVDLGEDPVIRQVPFDTKRVILVTVHRRESFGAPLERVLEAVRRLLGRNDGLYAVLPVHPNPQVRRSVEKALAGVERVSLTGPLPYGTFIHVLNRCVLVLSDSGGLQEEGPALGKPVLVLREVTERPEAIEAGVARLVGTDPERIVGEVERLLTDEAAYRQMARAVNPFGDGHAAERIARILVERH